MTPARQMQFWFVGLVLTVLVLYALRAVLLPFVAGMAIAYLCDPVADRLERWRFPRTLATLSVIGGAILLFVAALVLIAPLLQAQVIAFIQRLPAYAESIRIGSEAAFGVLRERVSETQLEQLRNLAGEQIAGVAGQLTSFVGAVFSRGLAFINLLSLVFITPIVAFYLLRDWDRMVGRIDALLPRHQAETVKKLLARIDEKLAGFVRGQLIVAAILGVFYAVGLSIVGLEFGLVVGLLAGAASIVPFLGSIGGFVVSVGLALLQFDSLPPIIVVAAIFVVGQVLEGNFLTPKLVGERVGLHPVWVIFALLAGGSLLGLLGVLLAMPVAAVVSVLIEFAIERYRASWLYHGGQSAEPHDIIDS